MYWRSGCVAPRVLILGIRLRRVVSFTPSQLCSRGKNRRYLLDMGLGGPHSWSERGDDEKKSQPLPGIETQSSSPQPSHYIDRASAALHKMQ
jgi:hypothetical protein